MPHSIQAPVNVMEDEDLIPDWNEATFTQKLLLLFNYIFIYGPVVILFAIMVLVYFIYIASYIFWLLFSYLDEDDMPDYWFYDFTSASAEFDAKIFGWSLLFYLNFCMVMFLISAIRAIVTNPGNVPDTRFWMISNEGKPDIALDGEKN